ncbi:ParM/StbA family protein [Paenibacillus thermotolerans]|uniref:ParM/StbA family protein n=1 Tax=Paenibacillus thermotolerans TaxID=3027807 RepID=UPI0023680BD8|nr:MULTISPECIES: ParM/StbA family protein [unclassified Paenibacillus]
MLKIVGMDVGNDSVKILMEGVSEPVVVPNVIALGYERMVLQEEESALQALDVSVYSPALSRNGRRYFVGNLAVEHEDNFELEETDNKAISDQSLIVALTALAYMGVMAQSGSYGQSPYSTEEVEFVVGTGLPVRTFAKFHKTFEERLQGEHEVTFHSTPKLRGRKVKVVIRKAVVAVEGAAAVYHMATLDSLQVKDEELYHGCIGVCEIGALTTDFPVVKRLAVDNHFSHGEQMGMSSYLDGIIREVEDAYGYTFPSRAKLVQRIKSRNYTIQRIGEGQADIRNIVDTYFTRAARKMVDLIKKRWNKYPDIQCFYVIGGGAAALRPYILEEAGSMRLRFSEDSELLNVNGYLKIARSRQAQTV